MAWRQHSEGVHTSYSKSISVTLEEDFDWLQDHLLFLQLSASWVQGSGPQPRPGAAQPQRRQMAVSGIWASREHRPNTLPKLASLFK